MIVLTKKPKWLEDLTAYRMDSMNTFTFCIEAKPTNRCQTSIHLFLQSHMRHREACKFACETLS